MSNDNERSVLVYTSDERAEELAEDYAELHEDDWWNETGESGWPDDDTVMVERMESLSEE